MPRKRRNYSPEWLAERVADLMDEHGWESRSAYELARQSGLSERYLEDVLAGNGPQRPRSGTLEKLAAAFQIPVEELLGEEPRVESVQLTATQQDVLNAVAAVERRRQEEVLQAVINEFLARRAVQPDVVPVLDGIRVARANAGRSVLNMVDRDSAADGA